MEDNLFMESIYSKNYDLFRKTKKGDLHVHGILGADRKQFNSEFNKNLPAFEIAKNFYFLKKFITNNIVDISSIKSNYIKLIELTIKTAISDGISIIALSIDYRSVAFQFNSNLDEFVDSLSVLKELYINNIDTRFDLGISRENFKKEDEITIKKLIDSRLFSGMDLYGDELSNPIGKFKKVYRYARKHKLELKAHVGEFGSAKEIYSAIKKLHLNTIQHGITIISNKKVMKYAKKHNVKFNVCPISNIKMGIIKNISQHPIRKMFDYGLNVTINTDDQLIFENSIFDEYIILFENKVFSPEELNIIRKNSLY